MYTITISSYTDSPRATGWTGHAGSELPKRLRRALQGSPREIRLITQRVMLKQPVIIERISESEIEGLRVILETLGAELEAKLG
ncbi:hypothetical protein [Dyella sp. ASV21]|uniref:hypothetical protein n=1 Tax=Dyella sp. ASV21 TaxID=2795114 RepID=UPI0018EABB44|nr:hypothetical protein [Dyella sp. ASV21]